MLVISRKCGEAIIFGDKCETKVIVLGINSDRVVVGISAPREVPIYRDELYRRLFKDRKQHVSTDADEDNK